MNRHRAIDTARRAACRRDRIGPLAMVALVAPSTVRRSTQTSAPSMLRARPQASARIEESVILATV